MAIRTSDECSTRCRLSSKSALALRSMSRSEEHTSELQSRQYLVCRLLLEKKNIEKELGQDNARPGGVVVERVVLRYGRFVAAVFVVSCVGPIVYPPPAMTLAGTRL